MRHLRTSAGLLTRTVVVLFLLLAMSVVGVSPPTSNTPAAFASGTACIDGTWTYDGASSPPTCTQTFQYIDGTRTASFTVPGGVTELDVELFGGKASNGDAEQGDTGWVGKVAGTVAVTAGDTVVVAVGGDAPQSSSYVYANAAGQNPLEGYDGGYRGEKGPSGSSRVGQSGGAASVLLVQRDSSTVATIVAGGAGGGGGGNGSGGSGGWGQTGLRSTTPVGRADSPTATTPTNGRDGRGPGQIDGAGSGGGGGGATGGEAYSCTGWDCNGLGGSAGLNGVSDLTTTAADTYVDPTAISSQITITYEVSLTATVTPVASPVAGTEVTFGVEFNFAIDPATLTAADFTLGSGAGAASGCSVTAVTGTGTVYSITVGGCSSEGTVTPSLSANAVTVSNDASVPAALQGINGPASPIDGTPAAIDNTAPSAPTLSMLAGSGGPSLSTGGVTVQTGVEFASGPSSTDSSNITYSCALDGGASQTPCPASFTGLAAGDHSLVVTATDAAGNTSSTTYEWTQAGAPSPSLATSSDTGISDSDRETSDSSPLIELDGLVDGTTVTLRAQSAGQTDVTCTFTVSAGVRSCELDLPADGTWTIDSKVTDAQGEDSTWSSPSVAIELDTTAPSSPAGVDLAAASDTGASDTDDVTGDSTPRIDVGGGSAGDLVTVTAAPAGGGTPVSCTFTVGSGTGCDLPELANGDWSISSTFTDPAGNESAASPAINLSIDATPPANNAPGLDAALGRPAAALGQPAFAADADPTLFTDEGYSALDTFMVVVPGAAAGDEVTLTATGPNGVEATCTFTASSTVTGCEIGSLADGDWSLVATRIDSAGNESPASVAFAVGVRSGVPVVPEVDVVVDGDSVDLSLNGPLSGDRVDVMGSNGSDAVSCSFTVSATVHGCTLDGLTGGLWSVSATVTDPFGRQTSGDAVQVAIPQVGISAADACLGIPSALVAGRCDQWSSSVAGGAVVLTPVDAPEGASERSVTVTPSDSLAVPTADGIVAAPGAMITVSGTGFEPGAIIIVRATGDGRALGEAVVGADGRWLLQVTIPTMLDVSRSLLLAEWEDAASGDLVQLGLGRMSDSSMLPITGGAVSVAISILVMALGGLVTMLAASRRQVSG